MTTTDTMITEAINRSRSLAEIVHITIDGDSGDALHSIQEAYHGETDYAMSDYEGEDIMDIWGWDGETPANEQDWRLAIRFE